MAMGGAREVDGSVGETLGLAGRDPTTITEGIRRGEGLGVSFPAERTGGAGKIAREFLAGSLGKRRTIQMTTNEPCYRRLEGGGCVLGCRARRARARPLDAPSESRAGERGIGPQRADLSVAYKMGP